MINYEQGTDEWFKQRLGMVTASRLGDICTKTKSGYSVSRANYMMELICEKLTGNNESKFINEAMKRGVELEPKAREFYALHDFDANVELVGFVKHPTIEGFGASPDALVNKEGLLEIKCPNSRNHLEFLKTGEPKFNYILQMHAQMMCTGREWCDFVSYDDRFPPDLAFFKKRIYKDEKIVSLIETEVKLFIEEMNQEIKEILTKAKAA